VITTAVRSRSHRGAALLLAIGVMASVFAATATTDAKPAAAADSGETILTVGTKQDVDSMNPYSGVVLSAYEVWNMQYNVLVNLSADDMGPIPELATQWTRSPDGLTWTFKLRDDVKWSDGKPLTSADVKYTFERTRDEEWANFSPFTEGFTKVTAPDKTTVVVTTKEPDPRLPSLPVYILPKHVWEKYGPKKVRSYPNTDPVTSGPFRLTAWNKGSYFEMTANKNYFNGKPAVDKVRFRVFTNDEAMLAALKNGEIDAIYNLAPSLRKQLDGQKSITPVNAQDGSFTQLVMNTGSGPVGNGHPALEDVKVRRAIAAAIDKNALVERVLQGLGTVGGSMSVAVAPKWTLDIPPDKLINFNIAQANQDLDAAGYKRGSDGIRRMPNGKNPLKFRFYFPSDDSIYSRDAQFIKEWLQQIGIGTTVTPKSEDELTPIENKGQYDLIIWAWTPYADPTAMMSYLTCDQVPKKPDDGLYNDAFFCDQEYDRLFDEQKVELDEPTRVNLVHEALQRFYDQAPYVVLYKQDTVEAYRNDRFEGWVRQPAGNGPIIYTQSDPSYTLIKPVAGSTGSSSSSGSGTAASSSSDDGGGGSSTGLIIGIVVVVIIVVGGGILIARRRTTADERE
jgi:peptide/nickel transport system substrate-binding protein